MNDLAEITVVKRDKVSSADRMAGQRKRKKNKVKKAAYMKKYNKSAGKKALDRKGERAAARGKTATGRDISVSGGSGAAQRQKEKKKELQKRK